MGTFVLARSVAPDAPLGPLLVTCVGGFALASAAGMFSILVPAGVGVRDGVLALLLVTLMPLPAATAVVVVARFLAVLADLLLAGFAWAWGRRHHLLGSTRDRHQPAAGDREEQLAYSEIMAKMLDEEGRRQKAAKIVAVVRHALGVESLDGLRAVDVGCSAGFIADELALAGATTSGVDIDEPGLEKARARFGERVDFRLARGEDLPFDDDSVDVAVLNHIYEHVVDPEAVVADIHRVLRPGGLLYLGIGHRWQVVEPHHRLPFLSWLPRGAADRYLRAHRQGRPLLRALLHPGRAAAAVRRLRRLGLHPAGAHRPGGLRRRRQRAGLGREGARRRPSGPPCRWCPPTCGRRSRVRRRPPARRCASRPATCPDAVPSARRARRAHLATGAARRGRQHLPPRWRRPHQPPRRRWLVVRLAHARRAGHAPPRRGSRRG